MSWLSSCLSYSETYPLYDRNRMPPELRHPAHDYEGFHDHIGILYESTARESTGRELCQASFYRVPALGAFRQSQVGRS